MVRSDSELKKLDPQGIKSSHEKACLLIRLLTALCSFLSETPNDMMDIVTSGGPKTYVLRIVYTEMIQL